MSTPTLFFLVVCLSLTQLTIAQSQPTGGGKLPTLTIPRLDHAPTMADFEGMKAASEIARQMERVDHFVARLPVDDIASSESTQVFLGYDSTNLYVVFFCFDSQPARIRARRPNRDDIFEDDSITVQIDTFHDQERAYFFGVNAEGIQGDGVWVEGRGIDVSFDTVYHTEVKRSEKGYIAFLSIPFRSMRFPSDEHQHWGILLNRYIARTTEDTFWPRFTTRIQGRLNQMATLEGLDSIASGHNLQLIPYFSFANSRQIDQRDAQNVHFKTDAANVQVGLDAKAVWHDKLVFDLTANPDFSQVESDDPQVLVNQRFEVFFPEKRHFFIENASYFNSPIQLLFTRRIQKPEAGARVTGKLGPWGIGVLVADDRAPGEDVASSDPHAGAHALYSVARVTRDFAPQSFVGAIFARHQFVDRQNTDAGLDFNWKVNSNWRTAAQFVESVTHDFNVTRTSGQGIYSGLFHDGRHLTSQMEFTAFSPNFQADSGFVPRVDIRNILSTVSYYFRPESRKLVSWGPIFKDSATWDYSGTLLDYLASQSLAFNFHKNTTLQVWADTGGTFLRPSDFAGLPAVTGYHLHNYAVRAASTPSNAVTFDTTWSMKKDVNFFPAAGSLPVSATSVTGSVTLNVRPTRGLTISNSYLYTQLGAIHSPLSIFDNHIVRSRWLYQFNPRWSIRLTAQYNALLSDPLFTSLERAKQLNGDFLLTYRINHGTALYVGYNHDVQNYDPSLRLVGGSLVRSNDQLLTDGRLFFVKFSYLLRL